MIYPTIKSKKKQCSSGRWYSLQKRERGNRQVYVCRMESGGRALETSQLPTVAKLLQGGEGMSRVTDEAG